jgi:arsenate reductase
MGEAIFNHLAPEGWHAISAGSKPLGRLNTGALAQLEREGISTEGYFSKSWNDLPVTPDIVLSVCGNAANEVCPAYLGPVMRSHWGVEDPAHAEGSEEEIKAAFMTAYKILRHRIEQFLALPLTELKNDPARLKAELDRIGILLP